MNLQRLLVFTLLVSALSPATLLEGSSQARAGQPAGDCSLLTPYAGKRKTAGSVAPARRITAPGLFNLYLPLILQEQLQIANPSFEEGWTDDPSGTGNQIPSGWAYSSPLAGEVLPILKMDGTAAISGGPGEYVHKCWWQLPQEEQQGGTRALILDGVVTYKVFGGRAHAIVLSQTLAGTPGADAQVNVNILAEFSGCCAQDDQAVARVRLGDFAEDQRTWAEMRDNFDFPGNQRAWNRFEVTAQFPASGQLLLEIVMQDSYSTPPFADFFIDDLSGQILRTP